VQGIYFVRYVDPDKANKEGFFSKLFGGEDKSKEAQRYRVLVSAVPSATSSDISVQSNDGKPETSDTGAKILKLLADELK
jgi:outer membrane protein assembly factor BamC